MIKLLKKLLPLFIILLSPWLARCGGEALTIDPSGTETGNPPSCLVVVEDCEDLDEDGICDESPSDDTANDGEPIPSTDDGGTETGNPENDDGEAEDDSGTGCLKVTLDYETE